MMNADAPMIGGVICPPTDAAASSAAAMRGVYPLRIIVGMVTTPTAAALEGPVPVIVANSALAKIETLPAAPRVRPGAWARLMKNRRLPCGS